jgi:cell wall assembly regulator SMI1
LSLTHFWFRLHSFHYFSEAWRIVRRIATSWKAIEEVLKEHAHSVYKSLQPRATDKALAKLETLVGRKLPPDFVSAYRIHNGMRAGEDLVNSMRLLPVAEIGEWLVVQREVQAMGEFGGNLYLKSKEIKNDVRWRDGWLPVMVDAGGNLIVLDLDPAAAGKRGQLFPWFNNGEGKMRVIAKSFAEWLDLVAEELLASQFTLDEFGGIQLRKPLA